MASPAIDAPDAFLPNAALESCPTFQQPGLIRSGAICAFLVVAMYLALHVISLAASPILSSFGGDEYISYYQSARNFNKYGFFASTFLQDLSTSTAAAEHPFVYNHMGAGPEITTALITKVFGERYRLVRLFFALVFVFGLYFFYRFSTILFAALGFAGAGYAFLLLDPLAVMSIIDHPGQATFPFFAFLPLVLLYHWHRTEKKSFFWAAQILVVVSTFFITYQLVILNIVSSFLLWQLRLFPLTKRDVFAIGLSAVLGVLLHIGQNICHLGPTVAVKELLLTISNRATGTPSAHELVAFYQSINVVHNGVHSFQPVRLFYAYLHCINFRVLKAMGLVALVFLAWKLLSRFSSTEPRPSSLFLKTWSSASPMAGFFRIALWVLPSILIAVLIFPAYSADYNLQGNGHFLGALLGLGLVVAVQQTLVRRPSSATLDAGAPTSSMWQRVSPIVVTCLIFVCVLSFLLRQLSSVRETYDLAQTNKYQFLQLIQTLTHDTVTMTNLYPPTVGFFTKEKVFGVAEMESFPEGNPPDPFAAYSKMIANLPATGLCQPSYYIHCKVLLPGFGRSIDDNYNEALKHHIAIHHRIVYEDDNLTIFKLTW